MSPFIQVVVDVLGTIGLMMIFSGFLMTVLNCSRCQFTNGAHDLRIGEESPSLPPTTLYSISRTNAGSELHHGRDSGSLLPGLSVQPFITYAIASFLGVPLSRRYLQRVKLVVNRKGVDLIISGFLDYWKRRSRQFTVIHRDAPKSSNWC